MRYVILGTGPWGEVDSPMMYMRTMTIGAHAAPMLRPYLTLKACGMILEGFVRSKKWISSKILPTL